MELFQDLFNTQTLANMGIVSALVTAIRRVVKVEGAVAVALTFLVSITYGILQFGLSSEYGIIYGAVVGIATAFTFYMSSNFGAIVRGLFGKPDGVSHVTSVQHFQRQQTRLDETPNIWQLVKFLFIRRF